jgi:hypothetical protein
MCIVYRLPSRLVKRDKTGAPGSAAIPDSLFSFAALREIFLRLLFAAFVPLADVAKGGGGAKSAFCGYS